MSHEQLSLKQRFQLEIWSESDMTQQEMAYHLGVAPSTVSREFSRHGGRVGYDARQAHTRMRKRRKQGKRTNKKLLRDTKLRAYVEEKLSFFWSPEQICGRLRNDATETLCHETIYAFIYDECPRWRVFLRQKKGKCRRRWGTRQKEKEREERKKRRIDERPSVVETRERFGDWEGDTIVGGEKTTGILTHVERKSGYLIADLLLRKTAEAVYEKTKATFSKLSVCTITYDNGTEFSFHELMERKIGADIYLAHPYHSWERGTNENTNGLIRWY